MTARVITVANRKGGVGKTTTVVNIAAELGGRGRRVLVVDLDTQAQASLGLGVLIDRGDPGVHGLFRDPPRDIAPAIRASEVAGVDVLPPARDFEIHDSINDPLRLQRALKRLAEHYDDVVIDTSPAIDVTMVAALAAADRLLIPTQLQHLSYEGVALFAKILLRVATLLNRGLADFAVVPMQVDLRVNLQRFVLAKLVSDFGPRRIFRGIRNDVALAESFGSRTAVRYYRPRSRGAADYAFLADDILTLWRA
jgi:chromosome partitioning protein